MSNKCSFKKKNEVVTQFGRGGKDERDKVDKDTVTEKERDLGEIKLILQRK